MTRIRLVAALVGTLVAGALALPANAAETHRLSIGTGSTGGVYYPIGGAIAAAISKYIPGVEATAEVTGGSVDNIRLITSGQGDLGFAMADAAWDAREGKAKFKKKMDIMALAAFYPSPLQAVTIEGTGIKTMADLKGKRVSTGAPGSGTETMVFRLLRSLGIDPDKDIEKVRLSTTESVNALKDRKIDAMIWNGGIPAPIVTDLAATPGITIHMIDHGDAAAKMREMYGPFYTRGVIPAHTYPGQDKDASNVVVWNLLVADAKMPEKLAYEITKVIFEHKADLVAVHKEAAGLDLSKQLTGVSPIPFHPGALKYFHEKGVKAAAAK